MIPVVCYIDESAADRAAALAARLGSDVMRSLPEDLDVELSLFVADGGLSLCGSGMRMNADFERMMPRLNKNKVSQEMVVKATKLKSLGREMVVLDATAGLGEDSLLLAASGCVVHLYERDAVIAALLEDAVDRLKTDKRYGEVAARMIVHCEDSIQAMASLDYEPDVVLLDPMFPERTKSASVKKKFQLIHHLESPCSQEEELLEAALEVHPRKVVIKRPAKGPYLANRKPSYSLQGKAVRYDCIVLG